MIHEHLRRSRLCLCLLAVLFLPQALLRAQMDTGVVRGTVTDATGSAVAGAKVTLTNTDTDLTTGRATGKDGSYTFSPVKTGSYTVTVEEKGFRTSVLQTSVAVQQQVRADFTLVPGQVTESVEVNAAAPQLQTEDSSLGAVATEAQIEDLPLNGRNYTFLAQLNAGVTMLTSQRGMDGTGSFVANGLSPAHNNYLLDGIDNNNNTVDWLNGAAYANLPPPDAIQEFKLQTSNFSAEFGRAGGAVVNAILKSGTNQFHGSAWEFIRNEAFDATPFSQYFVTPVSTRMNTPFKQHQFGASAGFHIIKDKLFFFGDYQGGTVRQLVTLGASVPTPSEVSSGYTDFRDRFLHSPATTTDALGRTYNVATILDPATTRSVTQGTVDPVTGLSPLYTGYVRDPFYTNGSISGITDFTTLEAYLNQLPASRLDSNALGLLKLMPGANQIYSPDPFINNNYSRNASWPADNHHFDIRVDYNLRTRDQMFGRVSYNHATGFAPSVIDSGPGSDPNFGSGNVFDGSYNYAFSETHTFSPTLINEARVGYSHLYSSRQPSIANQPGIPAQFGIQGIPDTPGNGGLPRLDIGGVLSLGPVGWASPNTRTSNTLQFTENLTKVWGRHSFRMGVEYQHLSFPWDDPPYPRGYFVFGWGSATYTDVPGTFTSFGLPDLLLTPIPATVPNGVDYDGGPTYVQVTSRVIPKDLRNYYGVYFQDDWKVTPKLTLNLGLRWDAFGAMREANGIQAGLSLNGNGSAEYDVLATQRNKPVVPPSFVALLAKDNITFNYVNRSSLQNPQRANFAPRIGLAYQVNPRLVARASYGIFYSGYENIGGSPDPSQNFPFFTNFVAATPDYVHPITYANGTNATLAEGLLAMEPDPSSPSFNPSGLSLLAYERNPSTPYTQQWNTAVQMQVSPSQSVTLAYVGNKTLHQTNWANINQASTLLPLNTNITPYIKYPDFAPNMLYMVNNGASSYDGLLLTYERRMSKDLQFLANYTRSVCKTDNRVLGGVGDTQGARAYDLQGWNFAKEDMMLCTNDVPNIFHASGIYQLPVGKGKALASNASRALDTFIGGWSVQGIFVTQSGFPGTISCYDNTNGNSFSCYAPLVPGQSLYLHKHASIGQQYLNPKAFTEPQAAATIGQTDFSPLGGPGQQFHGPNFNTIDFSMFKRFYVTERTNLEFRAEAFNLFNHPNAGNGFQSTDWRDPAHFGVLNSVRGVARELQFALKLYW